MNELSPLTDIRVVYDLSVMIFLPKNDIQTNKNRKENK